MSNRRRNLRRAIRANNTDRKLRELTVDPAASDRLAERYDALTERPRAGGINLDGLPGPGDINGYYCPLCRQLTVTIHADQGVTPMMLGCRSTPGCHGRAVSTGYRTAPGMPAPTHEWYRPAGRELRKLDSGSQDHVRDGGLMLRELA